MPDVCAAWGTCSLPRNHAGPCAPADRSQERPPIDVELLEAIENVLYSDSMDPDDHLHWSHLRSLVKDRRSRLSGSAGECERFRHDEHCADEHWKG